MFFSLPHGSYSSHKADLKWVRFLRIHGSSECYLQLGGGVCPGYSQRLGVADLLPPIGPGWLDNVLAIAGLGVGLAASWLLTDSSWQRPGLQSLKTIIKTDLDIYSFSNTNLGTSGSPLRLVLAEYLDGWKTPGSRGTGDRQRWRRPLWRLP